MIIKLFSKSKLVTERGTQPSIWFLFCIPLCSACCAGISCMHALLIFKRLTTQLIETNCGVYFWSKELVQKWWDAWKVCMRKLSHVWECRMQSSQISLNVGTVWDKAVCVARAFLLKTNKQTKNKQTIINKMAKEILEKSRHGIQLSPDEVSCFCCYLLIIQFYCQTQLLSSKIGSTFW